MGAGAQKSGGAAVLPAPAHPRSLCTCEHEFLHLHGSNDNPSGYLGGSSEGQRTSVELRVCIGGAIYIYRIISNMKVKTYKEKGTRLLNTSKVIGNSPGYILLREIT